MAQEATPHPTAMTRTAARRWISLNMLQFEHAANPGPQPGLQQNHRVIIGRTPSGCAGENPNRQGGTRFYSFWRTKEIRSTSREVVPEISPRCTFETFSFP